MVLSPNCITHSKHNILQTSSLRCRPVKGSYANRWRDLCQIKDEIPDLSVEHIRRSKLQPVCTIPITINQAQAVSCREVGRCLQHRQAVGIPNYLSEVVVDNRGREQICAGREVDDCRGSSRGIAGSRGTPSPAAHRQVDRESIIGDSIPYPYVSGIRFQILKALQL